MAKKRQDAQGHMGRIETMVKRLTPMGAPDVRPEHEEKAAWLEWTREQKG